MELRQALISFSHLNTNKTSKYNIFHSYFHFIYDVNMTESREFQRGRKFITSTSRIVSFINIEFMYTIQSNNIYDEPIIFTYNKRVLINRAN